MVSLCWDLGTNPSPRNTVNFGHIAELNAWPQKVYPVVLLFNEYFGLGWPFSRALPGLILCLANGTRAPDSLGHVQHGKYFLRAVQAQGSLPFYLLLVLWNKYQNHPLLGGSPGIFGASLSGTLMVSQLSYRSWDWGLKALLSLGNRRELCQDFWVPVSGRSGERRFVKELYAGEELQKMLQKMLQEPWGCSVPSGLHPMAISSSGGSCRAPTPWQALGKVPDPAGLCPLGLGKAGSREAHLAGAQAATCPSATRPASHKLNLSLFPD